MRLDRLRLATRLWIVIAAVVGALVAILVLSSIASAGNREAYASANAAIQARIKMAYQWAATMEDRVAYHFQLGYIETIGELESFVLDFLSDYASPSDQ